MKFTLSWLKDHLDTEASLADIADALTRVGLEVEGIEDPAEKLRGFTVARIVEAHQHPNADRLRVCSVDTGAGAPVQVVCGAPNARSGLVTVFSAPGTYIPGKDMTIASGVIRGVESNGMLCSASELGLSEEHDGILELPDDAPVGRPYGAYAGMDDPVIDVALTPNRPDAAGVHGIARDLAALGLGRLATNQLRRSKAGSASRCRCASTSRPATSISARFRPASRPRRQERSLARVDATAARRHRPASDQCARRYHQLHDLRPRSAATCLRCRQGPGRPCGAARPRWREHCRP